MAKLPDFMAPRLKDLGLTDAEISRITHANVGAALLGKKMSVEDWRESQKVRADAQKAIVADRAKSAAPKPLVAPEDDPVMKILRDAGVPEKVIEGVMEGKTGAAANHPLVRNAQKGFVWQNDGMAPLTEGMVKEAKRNGEAHAEGWTKQLTRAKKAGTLQADKPNNDKPAAPAAKEETPTTKGAAIMGDDGTVTEAAPRKAPVVETKKSRAVKKPAAPLVADPEAKPVQAELDLPKPVAKEDKPIPAGTPAAKKPAKSVTSEKADTGFASPEAKVTERVRGTDKTAATNVASDRTVSKADYLPSRVAEGPDDSYTRLGSEARNASSDAPTAKADYASRSPKVRERVRGLGAEDAPNLASDRSASSADYLPDHAEDDRFTRLASESPNAAKDKTSSTATYPTRSPKHSASEGMVKAEYAPDRTVDRSFAALGEERSNLSSNSPTSRAVYDRSPMHGEGASVRDNTADDFQRRALRESGFSERVIDLMSREEADTALRGTRLSDVGNPDVGGPSSEFQREMLRRSGVPDEAHDLLTRKDADYLAGSTKLKDAEGWAPAKEPESTSKPSASTGPMEKADPETGNPKSSGPRRIEVSDKPRAVSGPDTSGKTSRAGVEVGPSSSDKPRAVGPSYDRGFAVSEIQKKTAPEDVRTSKPAQPNSGFVMDPDEAKAVQERSAAKRAADAAPAPEAPKVEGDAAPSESSRPGAAASAAEAVADEAPKGSGKAMPSYHDFRPDYRAPAGLGDKARMAVGRGMGALAGMGPVGQIIGAMGADWVMEKLDDAYRQEQNAKLAQTGLDDMKNRKTDSDGYLLAPPISGAENLAQRKDGSIVERAQPEHLSDRAAEVNQVIDRILNAPPPAPSSQQQAPAPQQAAPQPQQPQQLEQPAQPQQAPAPQQQAAPQAAPQQAPAAQAAIHRPQAPQQSDPRFNRVNDPNSMGDRVADAKFRNDLEGMFQIMKDKGISGFAWGGKEFVADQEAPSGYVLKAAPQPQPGPTSAAANQPPSPLRPVQ